MKKLLAIIAMCLSASVCQAVSVTVAESTYAYANGGLVTGSILISWPAFASGATSIAAGSTTVTITAGVLSVSLVANDTADPPVFYTATFRTSRGSYTQQWVVPSVAGPLQISDVTRVSLPPITILPGQISKVGASAGDIIYYHPTSGWTRLAAGTNAKILSIDTSLAGRLKWITNSGGSGGVWGSITGTLTDQTDLAAALSLKLAATTAASTYAPISHTHAAADTTSGQFAIARLCSGTPTGSKFIRDDGVCAVPAGGGNVSGPGSATVNAIALWTSTAGDTLKNSLVTIDSSGNIVTPGTVSTGDGTVAGGPKWYELAANGSNFRQWLVPDLLTADLTMKFADAVPTAGQVMAFGAPSLSMSQQSWVNLPANTTATTDQFFTAYNSTTGAFTKAQPADSNLSTTDIATNNASTTKHGFVPKLPNDITLFYNGLGSYSAPPGGSSGPSKGTGYTDDLVVTTSNTPLCSLSIPGGTLGTGGASGSKAISLSIFNIEVGGGDITYYISYGSFTSDLTSAFQTGSPIIATFKLANNLGVTNAQAITLSTPGADAAISKTPRESSIDSTSAQTFTVGARSTSGTNIVHVYNCSIN